MKTVVWTRVAAGLSLAALVGMGCPAQAFQEPTEKVETKEAQKDAKEGKDKKPAKTLSVGDPAPALTLDKVIKGKALPESAKTYVVEFWATWCPPCRTSIPHLTELQKKHPKIPIVGVTNETADEVVPFVEKLGAKMDYIVALDKGRTTSNDWMRAAGQGGIPTAFVVHEGRLAFIGHPMDKEFDKALKLIADGTFDISVAIKSAEKAKILETIQNDVVIQVRKGKFDEALVVLDKAKDKLPDSEGKLAFLRFQVLNMGKKDDQLPDLAKVLATRILADDAQTLNNLCYPLIDPKVVKKPSEARIKAALILAEAADKSAEEKDANIADSLGLALFLSGKKAEAIKVQERAVKLAEGDTKKDIEKQLEKFRKEGKD